ncbi:MAG TPA: CHAT domain-containing tetratricopeptide repeat protein [Ohtaekwangia sp.]|nr:CHAT domain-containing tetratricopeptide repeat protein [Ohtaekwangia sp.]
MKSLAFCVLVVISTAQVVSGQILQNLKKLATDKAKELASKENMDKLGDLALKSLEKSRAEFDSTDFDYAILLSDNSGIFDIKEKGEQQAKFLSLYNNGASFWKNSELTDAELARFNLDMGEMAYASAKFSLAEKRFDAAKESFEKANLTEDLGYLKTISNQGLLYSTMGRFTQAEGFTVEALDMRRTKFGEDDPGIAASLNNYAVLKYNLARFNESEQDFAEAIRIIRLNKLEKAMPHAIILNNQAMLFQTIGRYDEAVTILTQAIAIAEKFESSKSRNHLKFLSNLALLYQQMGKYPEAEAIYTSMEKKLVKTNPDYASMLNNRAALYMIMGKEDKVEDLLKRSSAIYKASYGADNVAYAKVISDLGNFYRYTNRYKDAGPHLEKALLIRESTLGKNHPLYVQSLEDIAILNWKVKDWEKAYDTYRHVMNQSLDFVNTYFPPMSEAEKTKYWDVLSPRFQRFYNFAIEARAEKPGIIQDLYDFHIATKALLLNSTNKVKQSIFASRDAQLITDYVTWLDQKETLARLYAYSKEELKSQDINLDSIEGATNNLEKTLSSRSTVFSAGYTNQKITHATIQNLLSDTEAVVEIVRVQKYDQKFTGSTGYAALIVTKNNETPKFVILENGTELETRYFKYYRNAIQQRLPDKFSYDQYWVTIDKALSGKKTIYLSSDGVFNQINLNTLKSTEGDFILNRYDMILVGNSKDLVALKQKKSKTLRKHATLVGFPEYGAGDIATLPGTKTEIESIGKILKGTGYQVTQYMQKNATETNLKMIKGPALVHIATHGYFLKDIDSKGSAFGIHLENANDNPLLRSGIILAGGGSTASGKDVPNLQSNDNGILSAYEAMNLNLEGTELIVLSACETGLGDVKAGEGVYGLQRAFLVAGADALIMSLWKVDDAATQELMTSFYKNLIKLGNKQKAFKQAQLQLMAKYKEPYYWGAFVMMGM